MSDKRKHYQRKLKEKEMEKEERRAHQEALLERWKDIQEEPIQHKLAVTPPVPEKVSFITKILRFMGWR